MSKKTFVIAEMACSHEGRMDLAVKIIDGAAAAGADAVQLQIWELASMMSPQRSEFSMLKEIEFSRDQWKGLVDYSRARYPELKIYACVYEHKSIDFIDSLKIDGYKINSSDLSNPLVLEKVARTGKPVNLSVGASSIEEIRSALEVIYSFSTPPVILMYGIQNFPTKVADVNLGFMFKLGQLFDLPIGYQDHCSGDSEEGFWLPAAAIGSGADTLEKHITHDRSLHGIDHEAALNPDEFVRFTKMVRMIEKARGISVPRPFSKADLSYREFQKKSIVAARDLKGDTLLTDDDVLFLRAEEVGLPPSSVYKILKRKLNKDIAAYELIEAGDIK